MKSSPLSPARIARSLVILIFLSFFQSISAPIFLPELTSPKAIAADANDFPTNLGTVYRFLAESYTAGATTWPEAGGGAAASISNNATKVTNNAGTFGASKSVVAVQGSYTTSITFPTSVAYGDATNPANYSFIYVARYAPQQTGYLNADYCDNSNNHTTNNSAKKNRIFSSETGNWLSGFWACAAGVAYHEGWVTNSSSSVSGLTGNNGNNWLLASDCGYVASSTSTCNGRFRAFGVDVTSSASTSVAGHRVVVNGGQFPSEVSDFQIAEIISYPTILQVSDLIRVETYLARKYGINLSSTTATQLGVLRASAGVTLNAPLNTQPQIAIRDANGQTITTDNTTIISASVTGLNGSLIGTATATAISGVATFENLGVDGVPGNSYTITYSSNTNLISTSESRLFTRGGGSDTDTALYFDGTDYVKVPDSNEVDFSNAFTFQAWVKPEAMTSYGMMLNKEDSVEFYISGAFFCVGWRR